MSFRVLKFQSAVVLSRLWDRESGAELDHYQAAHMAENTEPGMPNQDENKIENSVKSTDFEGDIGGQQSNAAGDTDEDEIDHVPGREQLPPAVVHLTVSALG